MITIDNKRPLMAIDIETASQGKRAKELHAVTHIKAPSNYKDQEKIDAYIATAREKLGDRDGLGWHTGKAFIPKAIRHSFVIKSLQE